MTNMTWLSGYDVNATKYERSTPIQQHYSKSTVAPSWNDPSVSALFVPIFEALTSPSNATTSSPPPSLSLQSTQAKLESHRGAIVGGVIGGVVALAFIAAAMILTRRRLHRPDTRTEPIAKDVKELDRSEPRHELEVPTSELGSPLPELDVQNQFRAQGKTALS